MVAVAVEELLQIICSAASERERVVRAAALYEWAALRRGRRGAVDCCGEGCACESPGETPEDIYITTIINN
jgi:hypothetical protein